MTHMYEILAIAGWVWLVVVAVFLVIWMTIMQRKTRGFDVVAPPLEAPAQPDNRKWA